MKNNQAIPRIIPEFAILGHPNEGKSSVLSTLAEDDSVRISAIPGETRRCRTFPVKIDGQEIIRFTDTPGFQNPLRILHELENAGSLPDDVIIQFFQAHENNDDFRDDCELLRPLLRGAGIIYVADGSRPLRNVDVAEMEILRMSGKPRMAILNCKEDDQQYLDEWKSAFRKTFNTMRLFNAHNATYMERILLLEALKNIDQDWQEPLNYVVSSFKKEWQARNEQTVHYLCEMLSDCLRHKRTRNITEEKPAEPVQEELYNLYEEDIRKIENICHKRIRKLFKHNIFDYSLPPQSILHQDLFSQRTWNVLGLKKKQLILAGGAGGAALAAGLDIAAGGTSLGLFTTIGGVVGAVGALYGAKNIVSKIEVLGIGAGKFELQVGPNTSPQFPYILLDRAFLYYAHIINWAHGKRDYSHPDEIPHHARFSTTLHATSLKRFEKYFRSLAKDEDATGNDADIRQMLLDYLETLSQREVRHEERNHI